MTADTETRRRFRDVMGRFATGVTVITTQSEGQTHGMTANGFMSVSLEPPLVVISVRCESKMIGSIDAAGAYGVSVLGFEQAFLSRHFAGRPAEGLEEPFVEIDGIPLIRGAIAHIAAKVVDRHVVGDHVLFVGEVTTAEHVSGDPLIFHGGSYHALSDMGEWTARWNVAGGWW
ncbi:flavin oxidoreductase [Sinomonas cellulolyticus]|uniref:Flavin reductase n=1 Tax=Sinomonas cellulolyticus TaxID=2801916 RepID=A0ABS1K684_9MICC|nr:MULTISPECIES: flavin reductase family protein [Sinomonas]ASN53364.1 flavin oxidoreductase [Sinomonas sp. R1AF57]MBL0707190.1 flavin reductase [Sinomonas cellulolyticus]GHG49950.1 flavin oxidoreductase [Sinomonas sp. KCTC 49339]